MKAWLTVAESAEYAGVSRDTISTSSTSSRYLKPSRLALHTMIQRIDAQRRESGEAQKWEQDLSELRKHLQNRPQKRPQADRIVPQSDAGKTATSSRINRLGA